MLNKKPEKEHYTPQEYLAMEQKADTKSEYYQGKIYAMAGASPNHNLLAANMVIALGVALRGTSCQVYTSDMRVLVTAEGLYTYPDVVVVCGKPDFLENIPTATLKNPILIVEIFSESTKAYDRGQKFELYREIPTLQDYILIDQNRIYVEHWHKIALNEWNMKTYRFLEQKLELKSIDITIILREIYDRVEFNPN